MEENKKPRRKPISKKIRFEVFKRDGFTCQYCGRMAPDVVLVDYLEKWKVRNILQGKVHSEEECEYLLDIVGESSSWSDLKYSLLEALE